MDIIKAILCVMCISLLDIDADSCNLRGYPAGFVCVCNTTHCDNLSVDEPENFGDYVLVSSSKSGQRFEVTKGTLKPLIEPSVVRIERDVVEEELWLDTISMTINREKKYQKIVGFGAAFTGTVSYLLDSMPDDLRNNFYRDYYSQTDGIGYNMMRIPIGGCDFDLNPWAYNESPVEDKSLSNFTRLDTRDSHRIDQLNELKNISGNSDIKLIGTAWSPPRWMKTNGAWSGKGTLKTEFYQTWADYHLQWLRLMADQDVQFWALTTGNEPLNGEIGWFFIHFMSLGWLPEQQGKWLGENFGPTLNNSEFSHVKLFAGDDQRYTYPWWFDRMKTGAANALDFLSGLAVHWYWDRYVPAQVLDVTHSKYPDKILLNTESCVGDKPLETHGPVLGSWSRGEKYALAIIQDLKHHVGGWIDWNLILDENGGPTYINNTVDAAVILNSTTYSEYYRQPIFYVMAHFSKFIPIDSIRIDVTLTGWKSRIIKTVAFLRPDNKITIVLYNQSDKTKIISFTDESRGSFELILKARSINSFVFA